MEETRRPPRVLGCSLGTILGTVIAVVIVFLIFTGTGLYLLIALPRSLGLLETVTAEDVFHPSVPGESSIELSREGTYTILTQRPIGTYYNIQIESLATGEGVELHPLQMNVEYETEIIRGRPIFEFRIEEPGRYQMTAENSGTASEMLLIVPDVGVRNQAVLALFYGLPFLFILLLGWGVLRWQERTRRSEAHQKEDKWAEWAQKQKRE
jgi:hypothetical protein